MTALTVRPLGSQGLAPGAIGLGRMNLGMGYGGGIGDAVIGMDALDSEDLLIRLRDLAIRPQFIYSHGWKADEPVV